MRSNYGGASPDKTGLWVFVGVVSFLAVALIAGVIVIIVVASNGSSDSVQPQPAPIETGLPTPQIQPVPFGNPGLMLNAHTVIIGAGFAGISAAVELEKRGITDWVIVEAQNRVGGRMYSKPLGNDGLMVDGGAMWIQGLGKNNGPINPVWDFVRNSDIQCHLVNWNREAIYDEDGNGSGLDYRALDAADACAVGVRERILTGEFPDVSSLDTWRYCGFEPETAIDRAGRMYYHDFEWAETTGVTSTNYTANFPTYEFYGDTDCLIFDNRGYAEVVRQYMDQFLAGGRDDPRVILNEPVFSINTDTTTLRFENGQSFSFQHIINTMPLAVMQYELRGGRKNNEPALFEPEISDLRRITLEGYHMAYYHKTWLRFPSRFWDRNTQIIIKADERAGFEFVVSPMDTGVNNQLRPGTNVICVQHFSDVARAMDDTEGTRVVNIIMAELRKIYGDDIPEPTYFSVPRESQNRYQRASYSNVPIGFTEDDFNAVWTPIGNMSFAGEARCRNLNGYTHGAHLSGKTAGLELLEILKADGHPALSQITIPDPFDNDCWKDPNAQQLSAASVLGRNAARQRDLARFLNNGPGNTASNLEVN